MWGRDLRGTDAPGAHTARDRPSPSPCPSVRLTLPLLPEPRLLVSDLAPAAEVARLGPFPVVLERVPAGFPNPAVTGGHVGNRIDLHDLVGGNEPHCYFIRVQGESMVGAGIHDGDVCVVNRAVEPRTGEIVVAVLDGELTVKRFVTDERGPRLLAENPEFPPIWIERHQEAEVWGVVVFSLRDHRVGRAVARAARAA